MKLYTHEKYTNVRDLTDIINLYKRHSRTQLRDQQLAHVPHFEDMIEKQTTDYYYDGARRVINPNKQCCFKLKYLYIKSVPFRKNVHNHQYVMANMIECIQNDYIKPFALFINGRFIKWDMMTLVFTNEKYYILIDGDEETWGSVFRHVENYSIFMLYDGITYIDGSPTINDNTILSFDELGYLDRTSPSVTIENISPMVVMKERHGLEGYRFNHWVVSEDNKYKFIPEATMIFKGKELVHDAGVYYTGNYLSTKAFAESETSVGFKAFVNRNSCRSIDNIYKVPITKLRSYFRSRDLDKTYPSYIDDLDNEFTLEMSQYKKYDENFVDAVNTIMEYDNGLFSYIYKVNSNLDIVQVNGQYILDRVKPDGCIYLPRAHHDDEQYCMMMVNGEIYKYYYMCKYKNNMWIVPIQGIEPDDKIELMFFKHVRNDILDITITGGEEYLPLNEDYYNNNMTLFSTVHNEACFEYPNGGLQHFPVDYEIEKDANGNSVIRIDDYFHNRPLKLAYKNRFVYYSYIVPDWVQDQFKVDLNDKFMYCNDYSKYMVFVNGRRISTEHFRLILPVRPTTPFFEFSLYLTIPISKGDRLDVFYVPTLMKDIQVEPTLAADGFVTIDKSKINYGLSRDLYMLWINGKKIPMNDIEDVDSTHLVVKTDQKTTSMICITKYLDDFDYLTPYFHNDSNHSHGSTWNKIIAHLTKDEIKSLLGIETETLDNDEVSIYKEALPITSVMWDLIRDQYIKNPYVDPTDEFVYDYQDVDQSIMLGYFDDDGNNIIMAVDNSRSDNINIERQWP